MSLKGIGKAQPDLRLARRLNIAVWIISATVLGVVAAMRYIHIDTSLDLSILPMVNAILNAFAAGALIIAYTFIRRGDVLRHRNTMYVAICLSSLFLLSYVVYHVTTEATSYCLEGWSRSVYFFLLITHVVLAATIFPFILFTFVRAYTNQFDRHKRMARWVFPFWLYVAITGPLVYLMLRPCY